MKKIIFIVFILSFFLIRAGLVLACQCVANQTVEDHYEFADIIFSGKVIDVDMPLTGIIGGKDPVSVYFEVYKYWKNSSSQNVLIKTGIGGGDCGYHFEEGEEYLVYVYLDEMLRTNICLGTKLLASADDDLQLLGEGILPNMPIQEDFMKKVYNIVSWTFRIILTIVIITLIYGIVGMISWGKKLKKVNQLDNQYKEEILKKKHHYQKIIARVLVVLIILFFLWIVNTFKVCCA